MDEPDRLEYQRQVRARAAKLKAVAAAMGMTAGELVAEVRERERLRRERNSPRSRERAGELGEDRQVGMEPDPNVERPVPNWR